MYEEIKDSLPGDNRSSERFLYTVNRTFNLPNFTTGASIISGTPGLLENGGVPNITGTANFVGSNSSRGWWSSISGALSTQMSTSSNKIVSLYQDTVTHNDLNMLKFDASIISSVYNNSQKVFASGVKVRIYIKY